MPEKLKILITAMTYPLLSISHMETVCTAGVCEDGRFIRLYPVSYRYRPNKEKYKTYQWIEVEPERFSHDRRPESYRPVPGTKIKILGERLSTANAWAERKKYVLARGAQTMCGLRKLRSDKCSLGIIRAKHVRRFVTEPIDPDWKPSLMSDLYQLDLLGTERKPLEKIPHKFSYVYECEEPGCPGHKMMIEDWEVGVLYRKMRDKFKDEKVAIEKVRNRFLNTICSPKRDTHFFVGTTVPHGTWIIIGTFWPPQRADQPTLPGL